MELRLKDFYRLVKDAVKHYPPSKDKCLFPHTFAVINKRSDIKDSLFGYKTDKESDLLFFRTKQRFPAVLIYAGSVEQSNPFGECDNVQKHELEIAVVDQKYDQECKKCTHCQKRSEEELFCDTLSMLNWIEKYIQHAQYASLDGVDGLYSHFYLQTLDPADYTIDDKLSRRFRTYMQRNKGNQAMRWRDLSNLRLCGYAKRIHITTWEETDCILRTEVADHQEDCC